LAHLLQRSLEEVKQRDNRASPWRDELPGSVLAALQLFIAANRSDRTATPAAGASATLRNPAIEARLDEVQQNEVGGPLGKGL